MMNTPQNMPDDVKTWLELAPAGARELFQAWLGSTPAGNTTVTWRMVEEHIERRHDDARFRQTANYVKTELVLDDANSPDLTFDQRAAILRSIKITNERKPDGNGAKAAPTR